MPGRHRNQRASRNARLTIATVVALAAVVVAGWGGYRLLTGSGCGGRLPLAVAAAPDIAPAVEAAANRWTEGGAAVDGTCVTVTVTAADPAEVAAAIAGQQGATLDGVGQPSGKVRVPDVWVPDSSTWLARLAAATRADPAGLGPSIASSPVVLAMPQPVAATLGWPDAKLTWPALLQKVTGDGRLRTGIVEPARDASGLSGLLALATAANAAGANAQQATIAALRSLAAGRSALRADLLARFPRSTNATALASGLGAAPLPEQAVIAYNSAQPPVPLAALYLDPAPLPMDYPYTVMPSLPRPTAAAADGLRAVLTGAAFRDDLAHQGLRGPDGTAGNGFALPQGAPTKASVSAPDPDPSSGAGSAAGAPAANAVDRLLSTWSAVTLPGRMLAVIDVSGSMTTPVPTAGGATREQVTIAAAQRGLALFDDSWQLGLWTFSTNLDGAKDYRQLVPIGPVATQRGQVMAALSAIRPKPNGSTGLYDTALAAYKTVQQGWDPGRVNSVVLMTDGQNEDPQGITLDQLTAELKKIADPKRPVEMICIGIGNEVSQAELDRIAKAGGGAAFVAPDPSKIDDIFLKAIAMRSAVVGK
ncbi:MAG TPA: substrate-binding domain-containing protein [Micromonosporaceae bacterium]